MTGRATSLVAETQRAMDKGFRRCRGIAKRMQEEIEIKYPDRLELMYIEYDDLKPVIRPWVNDFYREMTRTLYELLRLLQPEDFAGDDGVNFYFLPGYHSHLTNKRIFYQQESDGPSGKSYKSFGVGIWSRPGAAPKEYHDCCHARWYHYATTPPRPERDFLPASPYHWFAYQQPWITEGDEQDLVASITFSTDPSAAQDEDYPEHKILNLLTTTGSSREWGEKVAEMLNEMLHRTHPQWEFPDRGDREQVLDRGYDPQREAELRRIRCLLISLWMHSVFESQSPDWWEHLTEELTAQNLTSVSNSIAQALDDDVACDWGDGLSGRARFTTWTTINLHPLISPPPDPIFGQRDHAIRLQEASPVYRQTIGWATMYCSVSLGVPFISAARQWIRGVYSMLRSTEVAMLLKHRQPYVRAAQVVRLLSHDAYRFMQESVETVLRDIADCSDRAVAYRTHIIHALRELTTFTYTVSHAAPHPRNKLVEQKKAFLKALNVGVENLIGCLYKAASDVQTYRTRKRGGAAATVSIPERPRSANDDLLSGETYVYCLLLVGEMVRNYCKHGPEGQAAQLSAAVENGQLVIVLKGQTDTGPAGENFAILENFLETLEIGKAKLEGDEHKNYCWRVTVQLSPQESAA